MKKIIGMLFLLIIASTSCNFAEREKYFLPEGFHGNIVIVSGIDKASSKKYQDKTRIYEIPASGILITQFVKDYGIIDKTFYYEKGKEKFKINSAHFQESKANLDSNKIYAFYGNGYNFSYEDPEKKIGIEVITVCKPNEYDSYIKENFIQKILAANISLKNISYDQLLVQKDSLNGEK